MNKKLVQRFSIKKIIIMISVFLSVLLVLVFLLVITSQKPQFYRIGYVREPITGAKWSEYEQLFDGTYTHLILAFLIPDQDGKIQETETLSQFTPELIKKMRQGGAKVLISVGGAAVPYATYLNIARDEKAKTIFFQKLIDIARQKELDGVDLNFEEWSNQITVADRDLVNQLGVDLAREMKATNPDWLISITLPTAYWLEMGFGCDQVNSKLIDLAHHLSYDYAELGSDKPNAPFRNPQEEIVPFGQSAAIEKSIYGSLQYYAGQGCQMSKIAGGIPFYTSRQQKWEEVSRQRNWVKTELNQLYLEKMGIRNNLQYFVDDPEAIARKVQMFKEMGLGGVVVWEVGQEGPAGDLSMAVGGGDS